MLKRILLNILCIALIFSLCLCSSVAYAQVNESTDNNSETGSHEYNEKIEQEILVPKLNNANEGDKITVYVWIIDMSKDPDIAKDVKSRMIKEGTWKDVANKDLTEEEWTDNYLWNIRHLQDEIFKQENPKIVESLNLSEEDIIGDYTNSVPCLILNLTKKDIERIAENQYVTAIYYIDPYQEPSNDLRTYKQNIDRNLYTDFSRLEEDGKCSVVIVLLFGFEENGNSKKFGHFYEAQPFAEDFVKKNLPNHDCKMLSTIVYTELTLAEAESLAELPEVAFIKSAGNLTKSDIPDYREDFPAVETTFDASSSLRVQRMVLGLDEYKYSQTDDVDGDGKLTNRDAMFILRSTINLEHISPKFTYEQQVKRFYSSLDIPTP